MRVVNGILASVVAGAALAVAAPAATTVGVAPVAAQAGSCSNSQVFCGTNGVPSYEWEGSTSGGGGGGGGTGPCNPGWPRTETMMTVQPFAPGASSDEITAGTTWDPSYETVGSDGETIQQVAGDVHGALDPWYFDSGLSEEAVDTHFSTGYSIRRSVCPNGRILRNWYVVFLYPPPDQAARIAARRVWSATQPPSPAVQTNPPVGAEAVVALESYIWATNVGTYSPGTVSEMAIGGPVTVSVTVSPASSRWDTGNGIEQYGARCAPYGSVGNHCTHLWTQSAAQSGGVYNTRYSVLWRGSYTYSHPSGGGSGGLGFRSSVTAIPMAVAEVQAVNG